MERMKQDIKYVSIGMYKQLEEENKNLRAYADNLDSENDNQAIEIEELKEENKKLKEERDNFMLKYSKAIEEKVVETNKLCTERNKLGEENKNLNEKVRFLEECLDRKEKLNEKYRNIHLMTKIVCHNNLQFQLKHRH